MLDLTASYFFSLEKFAHKKLFNGKYVWDALHQLADYLNSQKLGKIEGTVSPDAYLIHPEGISIGKGTVVEPGAYIQGPCVIGENCVVRHGAYVRGMVVTGNKCMIGHDTEIKHSILLDGAQAPHFNYVGDSILGNDVNLGAGVKCANFRFDHKPVSLMIGDQKIATGLAKLGAIIGDRTQLGCNCVTSPGTLIGKNSFCYPCLHVMGYIPEKSKVKK